MGETNYMRREIAARLKVSPRTVTDWARRFRLPVVRVGHLTRYPAEAWDEWLRSRTVVTGVSTDAAR